ncbi:epi-neemfruitin B 7-O-acetyltransferse L7AT-like [Bidens hawaiensis]|uniref:epi-neemfruitin B 7-O-acetyltransferse L7AT-like n=1 Tax=Bidens hawaiensis TaxID=980011 RepID=UPI0040498E14
MEVELISKENIKPSSSTPPHLKTFNLCILDQLVTQPYIPISFYYPNHNGDNVFQALERSVLLKKALTLVHGRCDDFLRHPDLQLINRFLPISPTVNGPRGAQVTNIQVNIFKCGGIVIGLSISHNILDGAGLHTFLKGWAGMTWETKVIYPNLTASTIFPAKSSWLRDASMALAETLIKNGKCSTQRFVFSSKAIEELKAEATRNGVKQPSRVEVVSALIWKCALATSKEACGFQNTSRLTHLVNLRRKLATNSSKDLLGNIVWIANAVHHASVETTLHGLVKTVRESIAKVDVEFVNEAQGDKGEKDFHIH